MNRARTRSLVLAAGLAVLACVIALPALADTHVGGSGSVGVHALVDSPESPGVGCRYGASTQVFSGVRVWSPVMYARDRTPGLDHQQGSWQIVLQRQQDESTAWIVVDSGPIIHVSLRDDRPPPRVRVPLAHAGEAVSAYRVIVRMVWYEPGDPTDTDGIARHRVDWYRWPLDPAHEGFCVGAIL